MRFIAFGSEELGLLGSRFYVDSLSEEERESTVAMLNFDALAAEGEALGVLGDSDLVSGVAEYGENVGIELEPRRILVGGSSDHASFQQVGIPVLFFLTDDFSRIHTSEDSLEFVNSRLMGDSAALAIFLLDTFLGR